ncbi:ABC transporter ATP-binding protein [Gracilibacillus oryzae]|uniref:ABC transporter ATP-binding protein n=1 Tax=Gracilibacillus oryzae TaxID=1672701 RepID=A0A7C8GUU4_9BACI|nr:ABC transporter ATP-binding protein [Gracilibacillus oryzae]KAB8138530.1 ABC transporter ATP-binding protein [Gracilibacillus oryzae]
MEQIAISMEGLKVKFPNEKSFLFMDLSLTVKQGEKVLLVGPSGGGKSTLLKILAGIIPNSVEIPMKYTNSILPERYGYVFQDPDSQFCMPYADEEIAFVLENLQIPFQKMAELIPYYLDTVGLHLSDIHTKINQLSGGMKQRLAIASVLALQPDVLFLDEPTAMLDEEGTDQVWDSVMKIASDKTVIIVEHKIEQVYDFVDRIIMINTAGEIIADGEPYKMIEEHLDLFRKYGIWYPGVWKGLNKPSFQNQLSFNPAITITQLTGYKIKKEIIHIDTAHVTKGDWIAITGANGSGKSTLLQSLAKLIKTKGTVHYSFTQDIPFYRKVGFVFQNPELQFVTNTVYDELAFSLLNIPLSEQEKRQRISDHLAIFQLDHVKNIHPFQLSVGQMKRLSIAAITIMEPEILLLDEPTFGQDAANTFRMLDYFVSLHQKGTTILMVTHDQQISEHFATAEWTMDAGKLLTISTKRTCRVEGKQNVLGL